MTQSILKAILDVCEKGKCKDCGGITCGLLSIREEFRMCQRFFIVGREANEIDRVQAWAELICGNRSPIEVLEKCILPIHIPYLYEIMYVTMKYTDRQATSDEYINTMRIVSVVLQITHTISPSQIIELSESASTLNLFVGLLLNTHEQTP